MSHKKVLFFYIVFVSIVIALFYLNLNILDTPNQVLTIILMAGLFYGLIGFQNTIKTRKRYLKFENIKPTLISKELTSHKDIDLGITIVQSDNKLIIYEAKTQKVMDVSLFIDNINQTINTKDLMYNNVKFSEQTTLVLYLKSATFFAGPKIIISLIIKDKLIDIVDVRKPINLSFKEIQAYIENKIRDVINTNSLNYKVLVEEPNNS